MSLQDGHVRRGEREQQCQWVLVPLFTVTIPKFCLQFSTLSHTLSHESSQHLQGQTPPSCSQPCWTTSRLMLRNRNDCHQPLPGPPPFIQCLPGQQPGTDASGVGGELWALLWATHSLLPPCLFPEENVSRMLKYQEVYLTKFQMKWLT